MEAFGLLIRKISVSTEIVRKKKSDQMSKNKNIMTG